jgi:hypothetical protein
MYPAPFPIAAARCDLGSDLYIVLRSAGSARKAWVNPVRTQFGEKTFERTFLVHADTAEPVVDSSVRFGRVISLFRSRARASKRVL